MDDPVLFLEPTKLYRLFKQDVREDAMRFPIGKANVVQEGDKLTIITYGTMVPLVKDVVAKKGVSRRDNRLKDDKSTGREDHNRKREEDGKGHNSP